MADANPIRVGIIGLSASAKTAWASTAHLPCLTCAAGRSRFQIVALCNSSVAAASAAIDEYKLDAATTRAYGSPEDLAADAEVDLVLCNTRVDKHYETALPSIQAGKDVYIEWPIASNTSDIARLVQAAKKSGGARVLVGLQGRWAQPVQKLEELLDRGTVGKVLSCDVRAFGGTNDREILPQGLAYFAQREVGGNVITIGVGHVLDFVQIVVGDFIPGSAHPHFQLQRPNIRLRDASTNEIVDKIKSNVPDYLSLHGFLPSSPRTHQGATLNFTYRRGNPFPSTPALTWSINGDKGEIRLVSPGAMALQADSYAEPVTIQVHDYESGAVTDVPWEWTPEQLQVPARARSVQKVLYAYADWKRGVSDKEVDAWVEIDDAAARAAQIDNWMGEFRAAAE